MTTKAQPAPRSLQEWMERTRTNGERLRAMVKAETGRSISATMMSFILRGSRRCSAVNAMALHTVTGVPFRTLTQWPTVSEPAKSSGKGSNRAA